MTDARSFDPINLKKQFIIIAVELIVLLLGVILFLWGLFGASGYFKIGLIIFGFFISFYIYKSLINRLNSVQDINKENLQQNNFSKNQTKKLVFDDFQSDNIPYTVHVVNSEEKHIVAEKVSESKNTEVTTTTVFELKDFISLQEDIKTAQDGPKAEFNKLIQKVLYVVKDAHFAHTVALFWINRDKQQIVLENSVSDSKFFIQHRRIPIGNDLISQIALNGKPLIVNYINTLGQADILPYYESAEQVKTFVGMPIFFSNNNVEPIAVLILDCLEADAYGVETISSLSYTANLISTLIKSHTSKYDLILASEVLTSISLIREQLSIDFNAHSIARSLTEACAKLVAWDYISVVLFDDNKKAWVLYYIQNRMNDAYAPIQAEINSSNSLVAGVVQSCVPTIIDDLSEISIPRFYESERCASEGSLMILPLNSLNRCYGALCIESKDKKSYSDAEVKLIQKITETSSWALEILSLNEVMNNFITMDETTGVATRKSFLERLQEETLRTNDFSSEISLVMISIDKMEEIIARHGRGSFDLVLQNIGKMIKVSIRQYDVIGRYGFNCFAIILVNTTSNEAALWAEKIRKNVASNILNIDNKTFSVTISIGVAGSSIETSDIELLENADRVLKRAIEAGGNIVRVY